MTRRTVRRGIALAVAATCTLTLAPEPAQAARPKEERFAAMVDEVRQLAGKGSMSLSDRLSKKARRHSKRMARSNRLFHSNLHRLLSKNGRRVGENVGYGSDPGSLLRSFLNSPAHAQNLLGSWSRTGVGIVKRRGRIWITQIFKS